MVKLAGPMFSMDASGTLGKTLVYSKWKGRPYGRRHVVPANPKSVLQVSVRAMMRFLSQAWEDIGSTPKGTWDALAAAQNISPFNAYIQENLQRWREFQPPAQTYPAPETGTPPTATLDSAVGGPSYIDVTMEITVAADAWGVILFRSPTGTFDTSRSNAIRVLPFATVDTFVYTDPGLDAGTYYYDARFFTTEGVLGDEEGEVNGTAT
jgi:hypothetical protein